MQQGQGQPQQAPPESFVVTVVQTPTKQTTLMDVVAGSLGVAGALVLLALVLGVVLSLGLMAWHRRHPPEESRLPPVA